jgi:protein AIR1/2
MILSVLNSLKTKITILHCWHFPPTVKFACDAVQSPTGKLSLPSTLSFKQQVMSDSGDEADSRTASFGAQRDRKNTPSSRAQSGDDSRPTKKRRRNRSRTASDLSDFVPKGASFSAIALEVDPDDTSSSGSDSESASDKSEAPAETLPANPHAGSTAPAISWNQGRKTAVRTTLGKRKAGSQAPSQSISQPQPEAQPQSQPEPQTMGSTANSEVNGTSAKQFKAVNGAYWRSRSASVSSEEDVSEEGEVNSGSESDDSELDSEADDSLMLNIGTKGDGTDDYDPENLLMGNGPTNRQPNGSGARHLRDATQVQTESKEEAFKRFSKKYPTAPVTLLDLQQDDMDIQAKFVYWDRDVNAIDLQLPVGCIECLRQGHMAEVCPTKEVCLK